MRRIIPFSADELEAFNRQRGRRGPLGKILNWWEKRRILADRQKRLFDCWINPEFIGGGSQAWVEPMETIIADGVQVSNTVTETIICPDFNIPAFYMAPGRSFRFWAFGVMSNVITTPGTLIMRVRWGGVAGTVVLQSAALGLDTTARTNSIWCMFGYLVIRSSGATGSMMSGGVADFNVLSTTAANLLPQLLGSAGTPLASGSAPVTIDTTTAKLISFTAQFSVATSPTNLTCNQRILEVLN
jgi:hypothetical protein